MPCRLIDVSACTNDTKKVWADWLSHLARRAAPVEGVESDVQKMLDAVRQEGDAAVHAYTRRFDCPAFSGKARVEPKQLEEAHKQISINHPEDMQAIQLAAQRIRRFHEAEAERSWYITQEDGTILGKHVVPVASAGLYVPGGQGGNTPLVSSLLMTSIPAQVAGVERLVVVSPPREDGTINPFILAAAHEVGITEVYRVGGAWTIAALAFGTAEIAPVDVIAGPGNVWVTTAKRLVQGHVGVDLIAGPSEVLVIADKAANPAWIAADMLSQAEHDSLASALCLTHDLKLADAIRAELAQQMKSLPRNELAAKALADWGAVVLTASLEESIRLSNEVAPEHLELMVSEPWSVLPRIRHAGAVFMGACTPEPLGDYLAGPNHVLPTSGTARFSSALSVQTFCKRMSVIAATPSFTKKHAKAVARLARLEQLEAHARSVEARS